MKKHTFFSFLLFLHNTIQSMDLARPSLLETDSRDLVKNKRVVFEIKEIDLVHYLNMISKLNLAKTCKHWYTIIKPQEMWYQDADPGWLDTENCKELNQTSYTHALIYYARQKNVDMFNFIHDNASDKNKKISLDICNVLNRNRQINGKQIYYAMINSASKNTDKFLAYEAYNPKNEIAIYRDGIDIYTEFQNNLIKMYSTNDYFSYFKRLKKYKYFICGLTWSSQKLPKTEMVPHIIHLFLLQGMNVNWRFQEDDGTFLHFIAEGKMKHFFVEQIMNHPRINVNIKNKYGDYPLHRTIFTITEEKANQIGPRLAIAQKLLDCSDIDLNSQNSSGRTPLLLALHRNRRDLVKLFLENRKSNLNITDNQGNSPLHYSIIYKFIDLMSNREMPLDLGACKKYGGPLHCAKTPEAINFIFNIPGIDVNSKNDYGETPLLHAIRDPLRTVTVFHYDDDQIKSLLANLQTNINAQNWQGKTALHLATHWDVPSEFQISILNLLLARRDIEVNPIDNNGETPLDYAYKSGESHKEQVITLLKKHGAIRGSLSAAIAFFENHKKVILISSLIGIIAIVFAYFHRNTNFIRS